MPQNLGGNDSFSGSKAIVSSGQSYRFLPEKHCSLKSDPKIKCSKCLICKTFCRCALNAYTCNVISDMKPEAGGLLYVKLMYVYIAMAFPFETMCANMREFTAPSFICSRRLCNVAEKR